MEIYEEKHSNGELSIPIESQIIWNPFPFLGIGMNLFADINRHESIAGVLAAIQLGQFR